MSKERELLMRWLSGEANEMTTHIPLLIETQNLLAQPEQGPVGIVRTIGGYPDNSIHTVELTCRHGDLKDGDLLYKAPQKREPLSEYKHMQKWLNLGYAQGIVDAEKPRTLELE